MTRLRRPAREIGLDPVHTLGDVPPGGLGRRSGVSQGGRGEIDRRDLPSVRSEPERVGPVTTSRIKGKPRAQASSLGGQMRVRRATGDIARALAQGPRPQLFPEVSVIAGRGHGNPPTRLPSVRLDTESIGEGSRPAELSSLTLAAPGRLGDRM